MSVSQLSPRHLNRETVARAKLPASRGSPAQRTLVEALAVGVHLADQHDVLIQNDSHPRLATSQGQHNTTRYTGAKRRFGFTNLEKALLVMSDDAYDDA